MRTHWLWLTLFLACPLDSTCRAAEAGGAHRYNVLFIAIDDLRPELGCYGVPDAQSPHLDQFARTALLFERHYVQSATCGASRYALLTGRSPAQSGVTAKNNGFHAGDSALSPVRQPGAQSLPELFRRSGYRTVCLGKISHTADGRVYDYAGRGDGRDEVPHAWSALATPLGSWERGWGIFFAYPNGRHREDGQGNQDLMDFTAERDTDLPDGLLAEAAVEQLSAAQQSKEPFFLGLGLFKPHLPFVAPRQDWDAFAGVELLETASPERIPSPHWHASNEFYKYAMPLGKERPMTPADRRTARRAYLACVRYADRQVGKVLQALDRLGLAENTIVVVWGDHGWHLGEQAVWAKHTPFEMAMRSTLLIRVPGITRPGARSRALVETIDLYPTLVSLCRPRFVATHFPLDGVDLSPVLGGHKAGVRDAAISYWRAATSVRTASHRLVMQGGQNELYDLRETLADGVNVAESEPGRVGEMRALAAKRLGH